MPVPPEESLHIIKESEKLKRSENSLWWSEKTSWGHGWDVAVEGRAGPSKGGTTGRCFIIYRIQPKLKFGFYLLINIYNAKLLQKSSLLPKYIINYGKQWL